MHNQDSLLKGILKRLSVYLLVLFMVLPVFFVVGFEDGGLTIKEFDNPFVAKADAATVASGNGTWISGKLTYTYSVDSNGTSGNGAAGTVSASGGTLTVTATNSKQVSGCSTTAAEATTTTVTVTNASSYPLKITTLTPSSATVGGVSQGQTIASGATFTITVNAPAKSSSTKVTGTVAIAVEEQTNVTITLAPSPYVSYTVNGKTVAQNGSNQTFSTKAGTSISLPSITAPSGYEFKGWRIGTNLITGDSFTANSALTVFPAIVTEGTDITSANFKVGSNTYTFWEDAVTAAAGGGGKIIVNLAEVTLPANVLDNLLPASGGTYVKPVSGGVEYILPAGVTLVVPKDTSTTVHTTTPEFKYEAHVDPTPFRTLTIPTGAKITVNGAVSVDSKVCAQGQNSTSWNGTPSGPHGKIVMKSGSEMSFNSGASLYCYGYINGDGNVNILSGATVYELFQLRCWRGGTATSDMPNNSQRVFPMNQYYVQNVEASMKVYKGATEYVCSCVNMSSSYYKTDQIQFIGSGGMFKLTGDNSDYLIKKYHANIDQLEIKVHGNMELNALNIKITGLPLIGTIDVQSKNYVLPINNMNIVVESGTTAIASSQTYGVAFLPSSKLTVNSGATFTVNAPTYFYDSEDWVGKGYGAGGVDMVVVGYSTANGTTAIRTVGNLKDAELDVNGTVNVSNKIYTTEHGANITSSEGTGVINFTSACATGTATTYQATQSGSDISYSAITVNNAWLLNGDKSYSKTVGTGTSTWRYDKPGEHWYRYLVDFKYNNNLIERGYYCELNDTVTYDASWIVNDLGASVTSGSATTAVSGTDVNVTNVTAYSVVTLTGEPAKYIPTFVLNEKQYSLYQLYTNGGTISDTTTIGGETYYIVDQGTALSVGTSYTHPTDASMGVNTANHNSIVWNMSGQSYTSGKPYQGTVPAGETNGGPTYIYGFYDGYVAHNSWNDQYYKTLIDAFAVLPQDAKNVTITLLADCGTFEEENSTQAYTAYPANNITLDLNGHKAVGRIVNAGTFTLELNGGILDCYTGSTAISANYKGMATVINNGTMTIQDTAGGGVIKNDATSNSSGSDGTAVIRNNAGATLTITGKDSEHNLTILENQNEVEYNKSYGYYAYNYGIYNLGTISALTDVDITTAHSRTTGVNVYNYNTGVINNITRGHMYSYSGSSVFNYGGTITTINGLKIDGKNGVTNRNMRTGAIASGYEVTEANKGIIGTITNCDIEVGQYAINNSAVITTIQNSTLIAQPDSAQVDTRGDGLNIALDGNIQCYTVYNSYNWWYDTNVWKQVDSSSGGYTRVNYYKEEEQYRPTIGTITNCEIYAYNTSTSASYGQYAFVNYGVINTIGGTTNIKAEKHPDNAKKPITYYGMHNLGGGIIKSIEDTVNVSVTGIGAVYNNGQFTTQINYTYANKVGGNITYQKETYGQPSTINSITCSGTWSCGGSNSYYYALLNAGYIDTIDSTGLTLEGGYNVLYNATGSANTMYEITKKYTDGATASTEYERDTHYVKNLTKGSTINTINGITVTGKGSKSYYPFNNQGHIGTLSNTTVNFAEGATANTSYYVAMLNGDSRYKEYTETIRTNRTSETDPLLTVSAGIATRYDRDYTYDTPTIDVIDNLTVNSMTAYAMRNAGHIGTLKNSTITGTQYALHNSASGPYSERQTVQYYSGTSIFATTKGTADQYPKHYKRNASQIDLIDNCTITTPANTYAMKNTGHVGTIKNSTLQAGTTTAKAYALANIESSEREYTRTSLEDEFYCTANGGTACTAYWSSGGENRVVVYDYEAPVIDLIGEGNTFKATAPVITNTGIITEINSGTGTKTTVTESAAKYYAIYNYSANLDARTTTTPYTAATAASTSGTAGTAVNEDTLQPGAQIGTIKNVYINSNGYGILNGDASTGKTPTIGEIGEGTEIYAHCTTAGYHAIYNQANAKITSITGGVYTTTKATTNAYKNNNTADGYSTLISGGDFKGTSASRDNAIFEPDNINRQTYPADKVFSSASRSVDFNNGTTVASGTGYYYLNNAYNVTFDMRGHGDQIDPVTKIESGKTISAPTAPTATGCVFDGWYKEAECSTPWNFSNDKVTENTILYAKWIEQFTVTFNKNGHGSDFDSVKIDPFTPVSAPTSPTAINGTVDENGVRYKLEGWYTESGCTTKWNFSDNVNADLPLYAKWTPVAYYITFKNGDTVLQESWVNAGTTPTYSGAEPTKAATAQYTYTFSGWSPSITAASAKQTYTAQFNSTVNKYAITWMDGNGDILKTDQVEYDELPAYSGDTPTKTATAKFTYTFSEWSPEIVPVSTDATYTAQFTSTINKYHVTWLNEGKEITSGDFDYDSVPTYTGDKPAKDATDQYTYTFAGWDYDCTEAGAKCHDTIGVGENFKKVAGTTEYSALFTSTVNSYTVNFVDGDGNTLQSGKVEYGQIPEYTGATPTMAPSGDTQYSFIGWDTSPTGDEVNGVSAVTGEITYYAKFGEVFIKHSLSLNGDIDTNFFIRLPVDTDSYQVGDVVEGYSVDFSWGKQWVDTALSDESYTYDDSHYSDDNKYTSTDDTIVYAGDGLFRASVNVAPKEIFDTITAELKCNGEWIASEDYRASDYLYQVIGYDDQHMVDLGLVKVDENEPDYDKAANEAAALRALCKATLDYAASAREYFEYTSALSELPSNVLFDPFTHHSSIVADRVTEITDNYDTEGSFGYKALQLDDTVWNDKNFSIFPAIRNYKDIFNKHEGDEDYDLYSTGYYGSSMTVESEATYTIYFYYGAGEYFDATAVINDVPHEVTREVYNNGDFVGFHIHGIAAAELTKDIEVTFKSASATYTFTVNPSVYIFNVCMFERVDENGNVIEENKDLVDLAANIYNYNQLAIAYFNSRTTTP